jgi:cellulose synthase/poly-beta-1,6-N-acetylglucosamine synthase-like glycosyltransferase
VIEEFVARLAEVMDSLDGDAEAIFVDYGSSDRTYELLVAVAQTDPRIRVVRANGVRSTSSASSRTSPTCLSCLRAPLLRNDASLYTTSASDPGPL